MNAQLLEAGQFLFQVFPDLKAPVKALVEHEDELVWTCLDNPSQFLSRHVPWRRAARWHPKPCVGVEEEMVRAFPSLSEEGLSGALPTYRFHR